MKYQCPNCKTELEWNNNNTHRPFCSDRCKNKDLIAWANEENTIAGSADFDDVHSADLDNAEF